MRSLIITTAHPADMNILLITPFQLNDIGGISVIVRMLAREWSLNGHQVHILVPGPNTFIRPLQGLPGEITHAACLRPPFIKQSPLRGFISFWLHLPFTLYALRRFLTRHRIDIVNIQYPLPWVVYFAMLRPHATWKLLVTLQGCDVHTLPFQSWGDRRLLQWVLAASDAVLAASQSLLDELRHTFPYLHSCKTAVVPNGAPINIGTCTNSARRLDGLPAQYILTVGQAIHRKGIDILIQALGLARDRGHSMDLVIVGDGRERQSLEQLTAHMGLSEHILFVGNQTHDQVLEIIQGCSSFVLASRAEGLPLAVLEAMACGKAVVATKVDGLPELINDGYNGLLVEPENTKSLAEALITLDRNPVLRQTLARHGQEEVFRKYTWHAVAKEYLEIFERLLNKAPAIRDRRPVSNLRSF